jgi:hypothetical protein
VIVTDPAQHRRFQAQSRRTERDVGRRTTEVFGEAGNILKPRPDLLRIEVDAKAPEANQIQLTPTGKTSLAHAGSCYFYQPWFSPYVEENTLSGRRLKRSGSNNQYLFQIFFTWNICSNILSYERSRRGASIQHRPPTAQAKILLGPTL